MEYDVGALRLKRAEYRHIGGAQWFGSILLTGSDRAIGTPTPDQRRLPSRHLQLACICLRSYDTRFLEWQNLLTFLVRPRLFKVVKSRDPRLQPGMDIEVDFSMLQAMRNRYYNEELFEVIEQEIDQSLRPC